MAIEISKRTPLAADSSGEITTKKICVACNSQFSHGETTCPNDGTALTTLNKQDGLIGTVLGGRYEVEERIGGGAMGEVYKAKHRLMKRQVAIKVMHPQTISGASALKRFQKEAEMASALNHPNVLTVHDFGVSDDGSPYLVMNYLEGRSLTDEIEHSGHLDVPRALHIFRQLCQGLGHAHEKGVIHRDLKPSNVMLVTLDEDDDFVQILDFGIAKQLTQDSGSDSLTRTGEVFGSPHYMSPEQCRAQPVDARSDIYALGCVMYRVLTGKPPLMGNDLVECLYKHVNEMPAPFSDICPEYNLPADLEAVVFKALAKKPEDRYQSMSDLKTALESVEDYQSDNATKTYGSLPGIRAASTLINLPASASIATGTAGDISTATATDTTAAAGAAITASASDLTASSGKPRATQTGDLPALEPPAADQKAASEQNTEAGLADSTPIDGQAPPQATSAGSNISKTATVAPNKTAARFSPKIIVVAAIPIGLLALTTLLVLLNPSGNAKIESLQKQAIIDYDKGNYSQAEQKIRAALNEEKLKNLPENDASPYLLGKIQYAEGDYANAQNSLETALKLTQAKHGPGSIEVAEIQSSLGRTLTALAHYSKAETVLQQAYQTRRKLSGDNSALAADSLAALGYLHVSQHSYSKAISELTQALKIIQAASGQDSPEAATALCTLGEAYQWSGNWPQAEALYKQALDIRKKKLNPNNLRIADSLERLASVYNGEGNLVQAKTCYEQALAIETKSLDSASPRMAQTRQALASILSRLSTKRHR